MTYTSTELSELTGFNLSQVSTYLHGAGYNPVGVVGKNQNVWQEECLETLMQKKHQIKVRDTILLTSLSTAFNTTTDNIRSILESKSITPVEVTMNTVTGNKIERYEIEVKEILVEYFESMKMDSEDEHPLVTDKRCLRLAWFPDIVPKCFEDLDEDIA